MVHQLPTTILGRTGIEVTRLGYGAGHRRSMSENQRKAILNAVVDAGINLIDTANDYGNSEELIGRYLYGRYPKFHISTKCGCSPTGHIWTRDNLYRALEESLERMKLDQIEIMQMHNPSVDDCEQGGLVEVLQEMQEQGMVKWIGVSTTLPHLPKFLDWGVFDVFQIPYSALEREHEEWITKAAEAHIGILVRGGVALGEPGVGLGKADRWDTFEKAGLDELRDEGDSRSSFMLRFTLAHPFAHTVIVGTTNPDHLAENIQAVLKGPLSNEVYSETKRRLIAAGELPSTVTGR